MSPPSALDPKNRDAFLRALKDAQAAQGAALLCVVATIQRLNPISIAR